MNHASDYRPLHGDQQYWQIADDGQSQPQGYRRNDESPPVFTDDRNRPDVFRNIDGDSQKVTGNDQNQTRGSSSTVKNPEPESTAQQQPSRLGWLAKLSIFTSLLTLAIAFVLLSWLWWTPREDAAWRAWVVVPNRLQLTITLASVCIRTAVGILTSISTAMIASVAVETGGVHLPDVAQVSITRFSSSGPLSLVLVGLRGSLAERRMRFLLTLLVITTFAAQFSSTILLSDLETRRISSFPAETPNYFGFGDRGVPDAFREIARQDGMYGSFRRRPLSPIFAEYSLPGIAASGVDDTGLNVRAFLPFPSVEEREAISKFTGMSHVFDSRVICTAPKVENLDIDTLDRIGPGNKTVKVALHSLAQVQAPPLATHLEVAAFKW
ncbi:hypothetical protein CkaCkLH20_07714 [Colletotrichum karsti]|uniref:Uncharacterized protein n=1 Tax=Colletotrichum karsti TaxID=1095194 RepID=A0A9P6IAG0_9PEZI|nr:uncharacterized protein CkaCkLH20_07714 [Colletotrichum karsti]KAF9875020.1 hypothetical protein CkaCkLH20_07714 [Colletotrichum karsti]